MISFAVQMIFSSMFSHLFAFAFGVKVKKSSPRLISRERALPLCGLWVPPCTQWGGLSLDWRVVSPERQRKQNWLNQSVLTPDNGMAEKEQ